MEKKYNKFGYWFIAPFFIVFASFGAYPILYTVYLSFTRYKGRGTPEWIGLENYTLFFSQNGLDLFWRTLSNTAFMWGVNFILQIVTAMALVMMFSDMKYKVKGLGFFRIIFYLPNLIAAATVALMFNILLDTNFGALNELLLKYNLIAEPVKWIQNKMLARLSVSGIQTWMWFGNSFILFMASIQAVSKDIFEAARIDGATRFQILRYITVPSIRPILLYVGITGLIGGLQLFDIPQLLLPTTGDYTTARLATETVIMRIVWFKDNFNYGMAATYSIALFFVVISIVASFMLFGQKEVIKGKFIARFGKKQLAEGGADNE
jgi:ABC-type sugar transport system permease subunit